MSNSSWQNLKSVPIGDEIGHINEYFANQPSRMLGQLEVTQAQRGRKELTLAGSLSAGLLSNVLTDLPTAIYQPATWQEEVTETAAIDWNGVKEGAYAEIDGQLVRRKGSAFEAIVVSPKQAQRIRLLMEVRDAVREAFCTQLENQSEQLIAAARVRLNRKYDTFVASSGPISARENRRAFADDPDLPLLLSLEEYDPDSNRAAKTAVFHQRTIEPQKKVEYVETASEALLVALNETGRIAWRRMEEVTGRGQEELEHELGALVFLNPNGNRWETADQYLSGNVRAKFAEAEAAAKLDPRFERNREALRNVLPKDLEPGEITAGLGAPWIPASDIESFVAELLEAKQDEVTVSHAEAIATWTVTPKYSAKELVSNTTTYGTARYRATELIEDCLNGRMPTAYDEDEDGNRTLNQTETLAARERQNQLRTRFSEWIWADQTRAARLARVYNERYNDLRLRTFDGAHLTLPGMVKVHLRDGDLAKHQKNAVWRILQSPATLLAHCVGAGKTWVITAAIMEMNRLGLAHKPLIAVPNHLVEQWAAEFIRLYPQARLFVAGKECFAKGKRQEAMARIATGTFDAIIVAHRSLEFLPVSDDFLAKFIEKQLEEIEALELIAEDRRLVKELEKAKRRLRTRLEKQANRDRKDATIRFEELGIDGLFVDEADLFKNLGYISKKTRVAGLPNTDSYRAFDMYVKICYLRQRGHRIVFATATPIANTMAEMYTMLRYLAPELLEAQGTDHFDAWAASFGREVTALELAPDGSGYRMHTRFAQFVNLPELLTMFRSVADVQTAEMLKLPSPALATGKPITISVPASPALKAYVQTLVERVERIRDPRERVDPRDDNMLKVTGDGRRAALDMRLVDAGATPGPDTKLAKIAEQLYRIWRDTQRERLTQLFFLDLSTPDPHSWNAYDEIRNDLISRGVPEQEIAFIHNADTDVAKKHLFDAVNGGKIRILGGSTEKLGAGTNVQRRLIALHDADAPWRPRDLEQRAGRILRPGNRNPEVWIYRYVTENSFDAYMWQTLEAKARFIAQIMAGEISARTADDIENAALTYAEIKAIASGNPAVIEKIKGDTELRRLDQLRTVHESNRQKIHWSINSTRSKITEREARVAALQADVNTLAAHPKEEFRMIVGDQEFRGKEARARAGEALNAVAISERHNPVGGLRGYFRGFEIWSEGQIVLSGEREISRVPDLYLQGQARYTAHLNVDTPSGSIASIEHTLNNIDQHLEYEQAEYQRLAKQLADYQVQLARPFEHEDKFQALVQRQAELAAALDLHQSDQQAQIRAAETPEEAQQSGEAA